MARRTIDFQAIRSEGGLLPPDLLRRVLDPKEKLDGTRPEDYGLPKGERLNEVITQSWNRLRKHWAEFRAAAANLPEGGPATGLTNDKWSLPLLRELGFGLLPASAGPEIGGRTYAITRFFGPVPIHLLGCGLSLDRRAAGVRGAAAANPHGLVQEFLNRSDAHLWAIVSNGLRLRILRDNQALSRQSFLEFDLEAMFAGEVYSDFVLLWLMAHATRFVPNEENRTDTCWLEQWTKLAEEQGTRALGDLRGGVERALQILGEGFTGHPRNTALRDALRTGQVSLAEFHGQLLRMVYRLIFLFVAEDRTIDGQPLLHPRDDSDAARTARECFAAHYSTARLRDMAGNIKGSRHGDLWRQFQILIGALSGDTAGASVREYLALPALGSFLWAPGSSAALNDAELTNYDFLEAIRNLAFTRQGKVLRPVDYKNLGAEELGGVYESLLALTPQISADGARFIFSEFAGNERKTSGSYYTPDSLVQCLLDSALDPVVEEAIKGKTGTEAEKAILALKVCDPAVGSGHFLVGAAHRLARHLARVRALMQGESEPSPLLYQHALRDVIGLCLYGVDINPMAAELCRVSLWLEALEPGKPLSFLDHHIRVGNSLLGTTPALLKNGIPDEVFKPIEGDDKEYCKKLKKQNKSERKEFETGQRALFYPWERLGDLTTAMANLDEMPDNTAEEVQKKQERYESLIKSSGYLFGHLWADTWCAAFVWRKVSERGGEGGLPYAITERDFRAIERNPHSVPQWMKDEVLRLTREYQFFHWHLEFPDVFRVPKLGEESENEQAGWSGGFDCVLGNPPWERIKLQEKEFFASRDSEIANAPNAAARRRLIARLPQTNPALYQAFQDALRRADGKSRLIRDTSRYPLCGRGDVNTYSIFAELKRSLLNPCGRVGCIVPSGIATDDTTKLFFQDMVDSHALVSFYDFDNKDALFPAVHRAYKFCLLTIGGPHSAATARFAFFLSLAESVHDTALVIELSAEDIQQLNPNTKTCPIFRDPHDARITLSVHRRMPVLINDSLPEHEGNPWRLTIRRVFDMNRQDSLEACVPADRFSELRDPLIMYESKLISQFNHRFNTYSGPSTVAVNTDQVRDPFYAVKPRYALERVEVVTRLEGLWNRDWLLVWRDVTDNKTVARTANACIVPFAGTDFTLRVGLLDLPIESIASFVALLNSFVVDYLIRQSIGGLHLSDYILKQTACPTPEAVRAWTYGRGSLGPQFIMGRTLELVYTAWDLAGFACECGYDGPPLRWCEDRRFAIRCELDAAFFHLYDISRENAGYILGTFPIVQRRDEQAHGSYRTKDTILEIYDEMAEVIAKNAEAVAGGREPVAQYQTQLNPPPGPPCDEEGNLIPMAQWDRANWPSHIHLPREEVVEVAVGIDEAALVATTYPGSDTDKAICAAALAIIEQASELSSMDHLDALLLATHSDWCKTFLPQSEVSGFDTAVASATTALFVEQDQSIRWKDCRDYLEQRKAISINHAQTEQTIRIGTDLATVKGDLPQGVNNAVAYALKALERIGEIRKDLTSLPQEQQDILRIFEQKHQEYQLVA